MPPSPHHVQEPNMPWHSYHLQSHRQPVVMHPYCIQLPSSLLLPKADVKVDLSFQLLPSSLHTQQASPNGHILLKACLPNQSISHFPPLSFRSGSQDPLMSFSRRTKLRHLRVFSVIIIVKSHIQEMLRLWAFLPHAGHKRSVVIITGQALLWDALCKGKSRHNRKQGS